MQRGVIDGLRKTRAAVAEALGLPGAQQTGAIVGANSNSTANQGARLVGSVAAVAPTTGTFQRGDIVTDNFNGKVWVCTVAGTPGTWVDGVPGSSFGAKGDLVAGTGTNTYTRLAVGTAGQVPMADATPSTGLIYANPRSGAETFLSRTNAISESMPRQMINTNTVSLVSGTVLMMAIYLPKNKVITNLACLSTGTAAGTPTHWWFTLTDNARVTLRSTADQATAAWGATTEKILALSSTFTTTYEGLYYIGVMMAATTPITVASFAAITGALTLAPILCGASSTGQTTAPADSTTLTAITAAGTPFYCYAS